MRQAIRDQIAKCTTCSVHSRRTDTALPGEMPLATSQMTFLGMDLVGPLPVSTNNNRYILTIFDHCSLWTEAYPIPDKTNTSVWDAFANYYLPRFACPSTSLTDNGWEFNGRERVGTVSFGSRNRTKKNNPLPSSVERTDENFQQKSENTP